MRRVPTQIEVYRPDTRYTAPPDAVILYDEGKRCVERGDADFVNHGKAIRLRRKGAPNQARSFECWRINVEGWRRAEA
jgi:hypothetical protein